jgi:HEAT repeat protein
VLVRSYINSSDWGVRFEAVSLVGEIKDRKAMPMLVAALKSNDYRASQAAEALGLIGDVSATNALMRVANSSNQDLRKAAREALLSLGRPADESPKWFEFFRRT